MSDMPNERDRSGPSHRPMGGDSGGRGGRDMPTERDRSGPSHRPMGGDSGGRGGRDMPTERDHSGPSHRPMGGDSGGRGGRDMPTERDRSGPPHRPMGGDSDGRGGRGRQRSFRPFRRHRRQCPFSRTNSPAIDYKDVKMLSRFLSEQGKIIPARISTVCAKKQRKLAQAIKRARFLALLPYTKK